MTSFRTEITINPSNDLINLNQPVLTAGSCFADVIGLNLTTYKFKTLVNSFGTTYNPHSIHTQLLYAIHNQPLPEHTFLTNSGIHLNYNFHSELSELTRETLYTKLKDTIGRTHYFLKEARWLIITYGTAWVYVRKESGEIVANCHKMPGNLFDKELFTQKRMIDSFATFYKELNSFNKNIQIILTVSPVRHLKDSLSLNSVSKSILRLGCHTLSELHPNVHYFPAFEIMLDDLRDYRFYKGDMVHPSEEAESYIWEKFLGCFVDQQTRIFISEWKGIRNSLMHRPFHPTSASHQSFIKDLIKQVETFGSRVDVSEEIAFLKRQLVK